MAARSWILASLLLLSCDSSAKVTPLDGGTLKTGKLDLRIERVKFSPGLKNIGGGAHASDDVSISGNGPHGYIKVNLDEAILGPAMEKGRATLVASPDGETVALRNGDRPWVLLHFTPRRKKLGSDYEFAAGLLASSRRTVAGEAVDWAKAPTFLDVAPDLFRERLRIAGLKPDYLQDPLGEVHRRGGDAALADALVQTIDAEGGTMGLFDLRQEVCRGTEEWTTAFRALGAAEKPRVLAAGMKLLATKDLGTERLLRIAMIAPLDGKAEAPAVRARLAETIPQQGDRADAVRAILLRRLVISDPSAAGELGCAVLEHHATTRYSGSTDGLDAAFLAVGRARKACPAIHRVHGLTADAAAEAGDRPSPRKDAGDEDLESFDVAREIGEPAEDTRRRLGDSCGVRRALRQQYYGYARAMQPR